MPPFIAFHRAASLDGELVGETFRASTLLTRTLAATSPWAIPTQAQFYDRLSIEWGDFDWPTHFLKKLARIFPPAVPKVACTALVAD